MESQGHDHSANLRRFINPFVSQSCGGSSTSRCGCFGGVAAAIHDEAAADQDQTGCSPLLHRRLRCPIITVKDEAALVRLWRGGIFEGSRKELE
jgi:hypothetical protein